MWSTSAWAAGGSTPGWLGPISPKPSESEWITGPFHSSPSVLGSVHVDSQIPFVALSRDEHLVAVVGGSCADLRKLKIFCSKTFALVAELDLPGIGGAVEFNELGGSIFLLVIIVDKRQLARAIAVQDPNGGVRWTIHPERVPLESQGHVDLGAVTSLHVSRNADFPGVVFNLNHVYAAQFNLPSVFFLDSDGSFYEFPDLPQPHNACTVTIVPGLNGDAMLFQCGTNLYLKDSTEGSSLGHLRWEAYFGNVSPPNSLQVCPLANGLILLFGIRSWGEYEVFLLPLSLSKRGLVSHGDSGVSTKLTNIDARLAPIRLAVSGIKDILVLVTEPDQMGVVHFLSLQPSWSGRDNAVSLDEILRKSRSVPACTNEFDAYLASQLGSIGTQPPCEFSSTPIPAAIESFSGFANHASNGFDGQVAHHPQTTATKEVNGEQMNVWEKKRIEERERARKLEAQECVRKLAEEQERAVSLYQEKQLSEKRAKEQEKLANKREKQLSEELTVKLAKEQEEQLRIEQNSIERRLKEEQASLAFARQLQEEEAKRLQEEQDASLKLAMKLQAQEHAVEQDRERANLFEQAKETAKQTLKQYQPKQEQSKQQQKQYGAQSAQRKSVPQSASQAKPKQPAPAAKKKNKNKKKAPQESSAAKEDVAKASQPKAPQSKASKTKAPQPRDAAEIEAQFTVASSTAPPRDAPMSPRSKLAKARRYKQQADKQKNKAQALHLYRKAYEEFPQEPDLVVALSKSMLKNKKDDEAYALLGKCAASIKPSSWRIYIELGKVELQMGQVRRSIAAFKEAKTVNPLAFEHCQKEIKLAEQLEDIILQLDDCLVTKNWKDARRLLESGRSKMKNCKELKSIEDQVLRSVRQFERLQRKEAFIKSVSAIGAKKPKNRQTSEVEKLLKEGAALRSLFSRDAETLCVYAELLNRTNRFAQAIEMLSSASRLDPDNKLIQKERARLREQKANVKDRVERAEVLIQNKNYSEALTLLKALLGDFDIADAKVYFLIGTSCLQLERFSEAQKQFESVIKMDRKHVEGHIGVVKALEGQDKLRHVISFVERYMSQETAMSASQTSALDTIYQRAVETIRQADLENEERAEREEREKGQRFRYDDDGECQCPSCCYARDMYGYNDEDDDDDDDYDDDDYDDDDDDEFFEEDDFFNHFFGDGHHQPGSEFKGVKNPYEVLGIDPSASQKDITVAYRAKAKVHHPDKHSMASETVRKEQGEIMKDVVNAYGILRDEEKKAMYDEYRTQKPATADRMAEDAFFRAFMNARFGFTFRRSPS